MPYTAEISRTNPTCFLLLVVQSASMLEPFGRQPEKSKAGGGGDALNRLLQNLVLKCAKADGIRDYLHIGLIGYGGRVVPGFSGVLGDQPLVLISQVANHPLRIEERKRLCDNGAGGRGRSRPGVRPAWGCFHRLDWGFARAANAPQRRRDAFGH